MGRKFYEFVIKYVKTIDGILTLATPAAKRIIFPIYYNAEIELKKLEETESRSNLLYIIIGVVGGVILITGLIVTFICIRKYRNKGATGGLLT